MAVSRAMGIQELLGLVAYQTNNRETLFNACLVNKAFNEAFRPYLYRNLWWHLGNMEYLTDNKRRSSLLHEGKAKHVRTLIMARSVRYENELKDEFYSECEMASIDYTTHHHLHRVSTAIIEFCHHFHQLRAFAGSDDHVYPCFVDTFKSPWGDFTFTNLRKLSLLGIDGTKETWRDPILHVVLQSPCLEYLSLSLSTFVCTSREVYHGLFGYIAEKYNDHNGHRLRLKTLRLGHNILIPDRMDELLDLQALQEISAYQELCTYPGDYRTISLPEYIFHPDIVPNLRKIFIHTLNDHGYRIIKKLAAAGSVPLSLGFLFLDLTDEKGSQLPPHQKWQHLYNLRVSQLFMPNGACSKSEGKGPADWEVYSQLRLLRNVTDLALGMPKYNPGYLVGSLTSLKSLWILSDEEGPGLGLAREYADTLPALRFLKLGSYAWRIYRQLDGGDGINLEPFDKWEDEVDGPSFFNTPLPWKLGCGVIDV
ncbi:hypothetical protein F4859DRAFT_520910 [Xylaria cf. heliscus]|nr:hypothetical protein F4859DRAFT_520910 [Xylaria cf. heliscus]